LLVTAPWLMKSLSVVGTAAMFMVGGSILVHGLPAVHALIHHATEAAATLPGIGGVLHVLLPTLLDAVVGIIAGGLVLVVVSAASRFYRALKPAS